MDAEKYFLSNIYGYVLGALLPLSQLWLVCWGGKFGICCPYFCLFVQGFIPSLGGCFPFCLTPATTRWKSLLGGFSHTPPRRHRRKSHIFLISEVRLSQFEYMSRTRRSRSSYKQTLVRFICSTNAIWPQSDPNVWIISHCWSKPASVACSAVYYGRYYYSNCCIIVIVCASYVLPLSDFPTLIFHTVHLPEASTSLSFSSIFAFPPCAPQCDSVESQKYRSSLLPSVSKKKL